MIAVPRLQYSLVAEASGNTYFFYPSLFSTLSLSSVHLRIKTDPVIFPPGTNISVFKYCTRRNVFCSAFQKKRGRRRGGLNLIDKEMVDDDDDGNNDDNDWVDDGVDIDDRKGITPFDEMKAWYQSKPAGFGEGKDYDISLEEKLLKEVEQSKIAQLANVNRLRNGQRNSVSATEKLQRHMNGVNEVPLDGVRVRVGNIPKKKNIHRDLQLAFKAFSGIIKISPAVSGNHKTRDPVCKGFAFIDLMSEEIAQRFVMVYSNQSISFGKVEKHITCHIVSPSSSFTDCTEDPSDNGIDNIALDGENIPQSYSDKTQELLQNERFEFEESKQDEVTILFQSQDMGDQVCSEMLSADYLSCTEEKNEDKQEELVTCYSKPSGEIPGNNQPKLKRKNEKKKRQKDVKHNVPGSAIRLKVRDRTVFASVFSKYGDDVSRGLAKGKQ